MFRIGRGHHVQHIPFPFPVLRDLDALHEEAASEDTGTSLDQHEEESHADLPGSVELSRAARQSSMNPPDSHSVDSV